ncbi:carbohydrate ABC transporter permease [Phytohabitans kaempferiae]|uniref:Carbohydrate ABC transporter permease n=1 Tax=Phytohabitans kaempferiae TaxID=1620943 RepID=A0ABV6MBV6_9ACTN
MTTANPTVNVARRSLTAGRAVFRALAIVFLVIGLVVLIYPVVWAVATSFKSPGEISSNLGLLPEIFTPSNYAEGWSAIPGVPFGRFFLNSLLVAGLTAIGTVLSSAVAAFAFTRIQFRMRAFWFALMIGTLLLPYHVLIVPHYVIFNELDWVGTYLPLVVPKFLATEAFFVFLMVQFMRGLPRELDEAAAIDGCGRFRLFFSIILPLSRPALVTAAIFSFIWAWNDFFAQLIFINDPAMYTVPVALNAFIDSAGQAQLGPMFAMAVLSLVPILVFFVVFQRLLVEGIATQGVKG